MLLLNFLVCFVCFSIILYSQREEDRVEKLFNDTLIPICNKATTKLEILQAYDVLDSHAAKVMCCFAIPRNFITNFIECKRVLRSKLETL